jgi:GNAT superfamily N-acetyltransferase
MESPLDFKELFSRECELLARSNGSSVDKWDANKPQTETPGPAGEPWITYTPLDRVGLAFSGGGIRSATFNLGVLKGLHELGVLKHVDYLSTVSGGGYIGAWWSAWRARWGKLFPEAPADDATKKKEENREPEEVRHLREFSNFLSPRMGFFQSETWSAIMAVLSAILPAMVVASSVMVLAFLAWLGLNSVILADALKMPLLSLSWPGWLTHLFGASPPSFHWLPALATALHTEVAPLLLSIATILTFIFFEVGWIRAKKAEKPGSWWRLGLFIAVMLASIFFGMCLAWRSLNYPSWMQMKPSDPNTPLWEWSTGISSAPGRFAFSPHLFDAPILWAGVALVAFVPRLWFMRFVKVSRSGKVMGAIDRALSRMLGAAVLVGGLGVLWLAGCWLNTNWGTLFPAGGAVASGGAFALLRNWIGRLGPSKKGGIMDVIKPLIPQILAYIAIALWAICIAALLAGAIGRHQISPWTLAAFGAIVVLFAIVFFDPAQVSMHSFYRNRLTRAYLGASNLEAKQSSEQNRQTDVRKHDDIELGALSPTAEDLAADKSKADGDHIYSHSSSSQRVRPLHLVCCAANDLGGDHLENLSRGSRSAVLSKLGFGIGNHWKAWDKNVPTLVAHAARAVSTAMSKIGAPVPRLLARLSQNTRKRETLGLGSAITASAAAFNSNMGSLSMTLGAGVTFLCTALNLRLGLWLGHPLSKKMGAPRWTPGWLFLKEMFGLTNSALRPPTPDKPPRPVTEYVHLSDGAHFENLGLYELVRRHCRYIIVSDCGADPHVAFDDFGNAVRRIREDFGVEIEIDLSPLKPDAVRISEQHVAVGTIFYDPGADLQRDTGVLVYLKPALTGDEPCDITQYRTRNEDFPHESTGDQFYDEAQWESYRRLGEHAAHSALRFVERERRSCELSADEIFNGARWEWYQFPDQHGEKFLELTSRFTSLEQQLREKAPRSFVREMFPELDELDAGKAATVKPKPDDMCRTLHFLVQMIQLMEDVWLAACFDTYWNHPNNLGWMNTFQRWAYTPSFRLWWPILKPMYGRKFRRFMEERLSLADEDYPPTTAEANYRGELPGNKVPPGVAQIYWERMSEADPKLEAGKTVYSFDLKLTLQGSKGAKVEYDVQAGLAFLDLSDKSIARWTNEEFFIPPSLWGAGLGARFLDKLLEKLKAKGLKRCEVTVKPPETKDKVGIEWLKRTDVASRQQRADLLAFYQRAGFNLDAEDRLVRDL